jgi:hypothetical protein
MNRNRDRHRHCRLRVGLRIRPSPEIGPGPRQHPTPRAAPARSRHRHSTGQCRSGHQRRACLVASTTCRGHSRQLRQCVRRSARRQCCLSPCRSGLFRCSHPTSRLRGLTRPTDTSTERATGLACVMRTPRRSASRIRTRSKRRTLCERWGDPNLFRVVVPDRMAIWRRERATTWPELPSHDSKVSTSACSRILTLGQFRV